MKIMKIFKQIAKLTFSRCEKVESDFDPIFREPKIGELNLIWTRYAQHIPMQKMVPKSEPHHPKFSQKVKRFVRNFGQ